MPSVNTLNPSKEDTALFGEEVRYFLTDAKGEGMVLAERCKSGDLFIEALTQNQIPFVFMEDITEESTLTQRVLSHLITCCSRLFS